MKSNVIVVHVLNKKTWNRYLYCFSGSEFTGKFGLHYLGLTETRKRLSGKTIKQLLPYIPTTNLPDLGTDYYMQKFKEMTVYDDIKFIHLYKVALSWAKV